MSATPAMSMRMQSIPTKVPSSKKAKLSLDDSPSSGESGDSDREASQVITEINLSGHNSRSKSHTTPNDGTEANGKKRKYQDLVIPCVGNNAKLAWYGKVRVEKENRIEGEGDSSSGTSLAGKSADSDTSKASTQESKAQDVQGASTKGEKKKKYGLRFLRKPPKVIEKANGPMETDGQDTKEPQDEAESSAADQEPVNSEPKSLEAKAIQELLSPLAPTPTPEPVKQNGAAESLAILPSETERFREDVSQCPDVASAEAYKNIPVEAFGRALLRGMGWEDGVLIGRTVQSRDFVKAPPGAKDEDAKPRPNLLGLGAKPLIVNGKVVPFSTRRKRRGQTEKVSGRDSQGSTPRSSDDRRRGAEESRFSSPRRSEYSQDERRDSRRSDRSYRRPSPNDDRDQTTYGDRERDRGSRPDRGRYRDSPRGRSGNEKADTRYRERRRSPSPGRSDRGRGDGERYSRSRRDRSDDRKG